MISQYETPKHPNHRPPYINAIPLFDIIRSIKGIKSSYSKTVLTAYNVIIEKLGFEYEILIDKPIDEINKIDEKAADVISAFRNDEIEYSPGGGGTYGQIKLDL